MRLAGESDLWEALGRIYLQNFEMMEYYRDSRNIENRKKFVDLIKRRLFEDIWEKMQRYGEIIPPFLENRDFIKNECKAIIKESENVKFGRIEVEEESFIIYVNKNLPSYSKRTVIAHELGHTFLYDRNRHPLKPYYRRKSDIDLLFSRSKDEYLYKYDEGFVYEIGRFLLIPTYIMGKYISPIPSVNSFMEACDIFKVTKEVMARKLFWDTYEWDSGVNFWKDAFLILYPKSLAVKNDPPPPKGNKEIFRGDFFRKISFKINEIWPELVPNLQLALEKPKELNYDRRENWNSEPLEYKGIEIRIEMKTTRHRVYIVGAANRINKPALPST